MGIRVQAPEPQPLFLELSSTFEEGTRQARVSYLRNNVTFRG